MELLLVWWAIFGFTMFVAVPRIDRFGDSFGLAYGETLSTAYHAVAYAIKKITLLAVLSFGVFSFALAAYYTITYFGG